MPELTITNRKGVTHTVLYDDQDAHLIDAHSWHVSVSKQHLYIKSNKGFYIHRLILGITDSAIFIDHINGNTFDCRRKNIRACTRSENNANRIKKMHSATSRYLGVYFDQKRNKWQASMKKDRKRIFIGYFTDEAEAAKAYDLKAKELHGEFARLNFPN